MMISFSTRALKVSLYCIMCCFMYDSYNNCNENVEIAIKTLNDFSVG